MCTQPNANPFGIHIHDQVCEECAQTRRRRVFAMHRVRALFIRKPRPRPPSVIIPLIKCPCARCARNLSTRAVLRLRFLCVCVFVRMYVCVVIMRCTELCALMVVFCRFGGPVQRSPSRDWAYFSLSFYLSFALAVALSFCLLPVSRRFAVTAVNHDGLLSAGMLAECTTVYARLRSELA